MNFYIFIGFKSKSDLPVPPNLNQRDDDLAIVNVDTLILEPAQDQDVTPP